MVEYDAYEVKDNERYTGAYVFNPVPGLYDKVVPFDFSSLYPTTIIAYNIDYKTLVRDDNIPDEMCHVIEWEDHINCEHDKTKRTVKLDYSICTKRKYRFLKEPMGVIPILLMNLLTLIKKLFLFIKRRDSELYRRSHRSFPVFRYLEGFVEI